MVISCPDRASTIDVHWYSVKPCSSRGKGGRTLMTTCRQDAGCKVGQLWLQAPYKRLNRASFQHGWIYRCDRLIYYWAVCAVLPDD